MVSRARQRDVHQPALLFGFLFASETAGGREPSIDGPDDEDRVPFLSLRRVRSAQHETVFLFAAAAGQVLSRLRRLERERGKERRAVRISGGDDLKLIEISEARLRLVVPLAQNVVIQLAYARDLGGNLHFVGRMSRSKRVEKRHQRSVCSARSRRRRVLAERARRPCRGRHRFDRRACGRIADSGEKQQQTVPADFVPRILENPQEREDVLYMRRLEELDPAPFLEWDFAVRELDLEIGGHVTGAEEHGDLVQRRSFLVQLEDPVDDESRLLLLVASDDEPRLLAAGALGSEILRESFRRARYERIGNIENRFRRAVILLERDCGRLLELSRKGEDVAKVRAAKRVNALRVVADDGDVRVADAHATEYSRVESIRVLILVDEDVIVESADLVAQLGRDFQHHRPEEQQVVVVDEVPLMLPRRVVGVDPGEVLEVIDKLRVIVADDVLNREAGVEVPRVDVLQRLLFRETLSLRRVAELGTRELDEVGRIALIHDREILRQASRESILPEQTVRSRVKGPAEYALA